MTGEGEGEGESRGKEDGRRFPLHPTPPHPNTPTIMPSINTNLGAGQGRPNPLPKFQFQASLPLPPQIQIPYPWSVPSQQGRAGQGIHGRVLHIHIYIDGTYIQYMNVYNNRYLPMIYCICVSVPDVMVTSVIGHSFLPFSSLLLLSC
jgi:hypothetical protein